MFLCTAQAGLHTHRAQISEEKVGLVTRAHDFQRGHLWSCVTEKYLCKDPFSLDLGNICPGRCTMQSRDDAFYLKKLQNEQWASSTIIVWGALAWPLGGHGKGQTSMSGRSFFLCAHCTHVYCLCSAFVLEGNPTRTVMCHCWFTQNEHLINWNF
jgi:hypothetical protein